jgi:predicted nucleic acid-binding protein
VRNPLEPAQAKKYIDRLLKYPQPEVLYSDEAILRQTFKLMGKYPALRRRFRDAQLAATLIAHGVKILVTADSTPFLAMREIEVENPFEALFA